MIQYIGKNQSLLKFLREHPEWYRYLSREPHRITEMERQAKHYFGQTWTKRIEKMNHQIDKLAFLLSLSDVMKD